MLSQMTNPANDAAVFYLGSLWWDPGGRRGVARVATKGVARVAGVATRGVPDGTGLSLATTCHPVVQRLGHQDRLEKKEVRPKRGIGHNVGVGLILTSISA